MVGVKAAPRGGREIVPGHVRRADIDAPVGHDVLGVIHARMARIPAHTSAGAVPARNDELLNLELARGHEVVVREEFKSYCDGLDNWACPSNRICRFLAFGGRFPCKSILRIPSNRKP